MKNYNLHYSIPEVIEIESKINKRILLNKEIQKQERYTNLYSPFSIFLKDNLKELVPLDGVINLNIFQNDSLNKTILLIGEQHQTALIYDLNATPTEKEHALGVYSAGRRAKVRQPLPVHPYDHKFGCTPIIMFLKQLFEENIKIKFNIDFFMETNDKLHERKEAVRKSNMREVPSEWVLEKGKLTDINLQLPQINLIRQWIKNCMIYRGPEFSSMVTGLGGPPVARLNDMVMAYNKRICYKNVRYHWFDIGKYDFEDVPVSFASSIGRIQSAQPGKSYLYYILRTMSSRGKYNISVDDLNTREYPNPFTNELKYILILTTNTTIIKESQKSGVSMNFLIDHFWFRYWKLTSRKSNWKQNLHPAVRIVIDMYLFCRLMKNEFGWYKNIIVYAGNYHIEDLMNMLYDYNPIARGTEFLKKLDLDFPTQIQLIILAKQIFHKTKEVYFVNKNLKDTKFWSDKIRMIAILNVSDKVSNSARLLEEKVLKLKQELIISKQELREIEDILFDKVAELCKSQRQTIYTRWAETDYIETTDTFAKRQGWLTTDKERSPNKNIIIGIKNALITALNHNSNTNPFFYLLDALETDVGCVTERIPQQSRKKTFA